MDDSASILEIYEMFLDNIPLAVWIEDTDLKIMYLNSMYEKMYDVKLNEVIGKTNEEAFPKELAEIYNKEIKECIDNNSIQIVQGIVKGTIVECWIVPLKDKNDNLKERI